MDRDRLQEVRRTEQTESRVNEDLIEWLKTSGPTYLLVILLVFTAYFVWVRYTQGQAERHQQAWVAYLEAQMTDLPGSYEAVAEDYPNVDQIATLARLRAGQRLLNAVQINRPLGAAPPEFGQHDPDREVLSDDDRRAYLERAERLYRTVLERDDGSPGMTLHAVNALNGLAAVMEARDDVETAVQYYNWAAERADALYPDLARRSRARAETIEQYMEPVELAPGEPFTPRPMFVDERREATMIPALGDIILPDEE